MSFPSSFSSQLAAIMEALLKAVVTEVTALVEDGAVELRLELRDRERQILEKERDIEERDRVIEELRAAVEELTAREEATVSPVGDTGEADSDKGGGGGEADSPPIIKCEPPEDEPHELQWPPPLLPAPLSTMKVSFPTTATTSAAGEYNEDSTSTKDSLTQGFHAYNSHSTSPNETEDFSRFEPAELNLETLLNMKQEQFYSAEQPGFPMAPPVPPEQERNGFNWTKRLNCAAYRCDRCGKTFTGKKRLATHQTVHTGAKPYSCEKCGTRFSRTDSLARHRRKPDACPGKNLERVVLPCHNVPAGGRP